MTIRKICAAFAAFALAGTCLAQGRAPAIGDTNPLEIRAEPEVQPALAAAHVVKSLRTALDAIPNVALEAPASDELPGKALVAEKAGAPLQVGFGRALAPLATESAMGWQLAWRASPEGGWIGAVSVTSPAASALRIGLRVEALPAGASLRFHGPGSGEVFEVTAAQIRATIERNLDAGEAAEAARTYWSPVVESDTIVVEIELPRDASPAQVRVAAPMVSHLVTRASSNFVIPKAAALSCEIDAMCFQDKWSTESKAVARIVFTKDGSSWVCSGTLLADKDTTTFIPYFLTANHCIASQAVASSIQSYWFYRSTVCDSGVRGSFQTLVGGGTLLYSTTYTDTAFLRLNGSPPAGVGYAGWLASTAPAATSAATAIHHAAGDLQKITFGNVAAFWTCAPSSDGNFECNGAPVSTATFFTVAWRSGITEQGSSGAGVFLDNGHYLIGQLYGGTNSCTAGGGRDWFGRFDIAYNSALHQWLGNTASLSPQPTVNYSDMWWNPDESGWGLSITQHSAMIFAAWYIYDSAGRPRWIVMPGGQWTSTTSFTGDLYTATGPDPRGAFDPALVTRTRVGSGTLAFTASDRATFSYTVDGVPESRQIQRQLFGPVDTPLATNYGDMWWKESESGWGLSISQQYRTLIAVWYAYGADGRPLWYVVPSGTWSGDTYSGTIYRTTAAPNPFFGSSFNASAVSRIPVGTMQLRFINSANAVMTYTIDGATGSKAITRAAF